MMTKSPDTDARSAVRSYLKSHAEELKIEGDTLRNWQAAVRSRAIVINGESLRYVLGEDSNIAALAAKARGGDLAAWGACVYVIEYCRDNGFEPPQCLLNIAIETMRGDLSIPRRRGNNFPDKNILRNHVIAIAVYRAVECGLGRYSDGLSQKLTACDLVSAELRSIAGIHLEPSAINKISKPYLAGEL